MIKKLFTIFVLFSFLSIGIIGFSSMNHGIEHTSGCMFSVADSTPCPENIIAMTVHHLQAYTSLLNILPPTQSLLVVLLLCSLLVGLVFCLYKLVTHTSRSFRLRSHSFEYPPIHSWKIIKWLALFENSPSMQKISIITSNYINLCKQKSLRKIKNIKISIKHWYSTLSAGWNLMQTVLKRAQIIKGKPITFVPFTARIILQPIQ
ncbi:MAG: hypothetical protein RJA61_254 [Candidatus Parcubacteria bacterium]